MNKRKNKAQQAVVESRFEETYETVHDEQEKFKIALSEFVHVKTVDRPMKRLVAMLKLRDELLTLSEEMNDRLKDILERFGEEAYDKETDEGLLEVPLPDYQSCFSVDAEKVQGLLWQEEKRMRDELTKAEDDSERLKTEMNGFLLENANGLEKFLRTAEG